MSPFALLTAAVLAVGGSVTGTVTAGDTGEPLPQAVVTISELDRQTRTDASGRFLVQTIPEGRWRITAAHPDYRPVTLLLVVTGDESARVDFELSPARSRPALHGRVVEAGTGQVVSAAEVMVGRERHLADLEGYFEFPESAEFPAPVRVRAYGYLQLDTVLSAPPSGPLLLVVRPSPVGLRPVSVRVRGQRTEEAAEAQALFEREPRPGVVGVSRETLASVPSLGEVDVLRSLQALPGVVQVNDLSARLHVRGGGPDQNLVLLDGAPLFAGYHLFGMLGAVNPDALDRVEFFRGDLPARYGGSLSSVLDLKLREDATGWIDGNLGLGMLSGRLAARGIVPVAQGRWMVAGRRALLGETLAALSGDDDIFPARFHDLHLRLSLEPVPGHRLQTSYFTSDDAFRMFLRNLGGGHQSTWQNRVGTLGWEWDPAPNWKSSVRAWRSGYRVALEVGKGTLAPRTTGDLDMTGLRLELTHRVGQTVVRTGVEFQNGYVRLRGEETEGGYLVGESSVPWRWLAGYTELDRHWGRIRLSPGVRVEISDDRDELLVAPRLSARVDLPRELSITLGASRTYQALSTLRDDRYPLPGPPFWFAHAPDQPVSLADGLSAVIDGRHGRSWSFTAGAWARRFQDLPAWRPVGSRVFTDLQWHDGTARGLEVTVRRHDAALGGWASYGYSRAVWTDTLGVDYSPVWDRPHALDLALIARRSRFTLGTRITYGTGTPFWPQVGVLPGHTYEPGSGSIDRDGIFPVWSDEQLRYPARFRWDVTARATFSGWGMRIRPFVGILNLTGRKNVLLYEYGAPAPPPASEPAEPATYLLRPVTALPAIIPSFGIDIEF